MLELGLPRSLVRFAAIALVAVGASACSSVPNWVNPTNWMGGDDQTAGATADPANGQTPDFASIPDKPVAPSTADERKQVADTLKADRADAQYSADALRGGTEPSAAAPADASSSISPPSAPAAADQPAAVPQPAQTADAASAGSPAQAAATTAAAPEQSAPAPAAAAPEQSAPAAAAPVAQVANTEPATAETSTTPAPASDDQLGFESSKAPPLDPAVAHFVPRAVMDQYQQTSTGASPAVAPTLTPPTPSKADPAQSSSIDPPTDNHVRHASYNGPASNGTASLAGSPYSGMVTPAAYRPGQQSQSRAVVFFSHDAAVLNPKARAQILATARSYQNRGVSGFVRVVGHSSSRTGDMPLARHLEVVFRHSQDFATTVANELIRDGVPADKVLIEAVGDSQPVYLESMPEGEAGNRRAEIIM